MENIENYQPLCNRINKMITDFDIYPLMPTGDWTIEFIENVFSFDPLFVLDDFKKEIMNILLEKTDYKYSEEELMPIVYDTYIKREKELKQGVLDRIIKNFKEEVDRTSFKYHLRSQLRVDETVLFYYAYSIFYIAKEISSASGLLLARNALKSIDLICCEKDSLPYDGIQSTGKLLKLSEFSRDKEVYDKLKIMIENEINNSDDESVKQELERIIEEEKKQEKGCYIATCVYGSYDCPQVWTLRRYRDYTLAETWYGRVFIRAYYAISPTVVKWFGHTEWFKKILQSKLDRMVDRLQSKGVESSPYEDRD